VFPPPTEFLEKGRGPTQNSAMSFSEFDAKMVSY
jgi:hypothetical protein